MANEQNTEKFFLVMGATGRQGGAVTRHLLGRGHRVRALTRNPNRPAARALAGIGAEVARGDLDDRPSVERALEGAYGVFAVQNFWEAGYEREVRQGITLADAAKAQGVKHFVYSSVGSSYRKTGIPAFDSKWEIEEHIRKIGLPSVCTAGAEPNSCLSLAALELGYARVKEEVQEPIGGYASAIPGAFGLEQVRRSPEKRC